MNTCLSQRDSKTVGSLGQKLRKCLFLLLFIGTVLLAIPGPMSAYAKAAPKLNKTKISLAVGAKYKLKLKNNKKKVKWSSSKKKVASVSKKGVVTALSAGTATIKAKAGNKTYKCKVTVKKPVTVTKTAEQETGDGKTTEKAPYIVDWCWRSYMEGGLGRLTVAVTVCNPADRVLYMPRIAVRGYDSAGNLLTKYNYINISYIAPHDTVTVSDIFSTGDVPADKVDVRLESGMDGSTNFFYMAPDSSKYTSTDKLSVTNLKMSEDPSRSKVFTGTLVNNSGFADLRGTVSLVFYKDGRLVFNGSKYYFNLKYAENNEVYVQLSPEAYKQVDPSWVWKLVAFPTGRSE